MPVLEVDVTCPQCGAVSQRREILAEVVPGVVIAPCEVIWCQRCGTEIAPGATTGEGER